MNKETKEPKRRVEIYHNGNWKRTEMSKLKIGDIFRIFNPDNIPVVYQQGTNFIALKEPYYDEKNHTWGVMADAVYGTTAHTLLSYQEKINNNIAATPPITDRQR